MCTMRSLALCWLLQRAANGTPPETEPHAEQHALHSPTDQAHFITGIGQENGATSCLKTCML
jgi:hypothetical protein